MSPTALFLRTRLFGALRAWRHDRGSQVALLVGGAVALLMARSGVDTLSAQVPAWQAAGERVLTTRLFLLCLGACAATLFFAGLGTVRAGFGDEAQLLRTLPLSAATRLRLLYAQVLLEDVSTWALLSLGILGLSLPGNPWTWVIFLLSGLLLTPLLALVMLSVAGTFAVATHLTRLTMMLAAPVLLGLVSAVALLPRWPPLGGSAPLLVLLALALGPAAEAAGRMYLHSVQALQQRERSLDVRLAPGVRPLAQWLRARRSPTSALLLKDLLTRSRSVLSWLRLLVLPGYMVLVVWLHGRGVLAGLNDLLWVVGGSGLLLLLFMMDSQPSPLGAEGARLTLLLSAPVSPSTVLRSKWEAFFWTHLPLAGVALIGFGWHFGLGRAAWLVAGASTVLTLLGLTTLFAWGSAADIDLETAPQGSIDTFLLEEAPLTLPRVMLVNLGGGFVGAVALLLWGSPPHVALPLLAALNLALLLTGWQVAHRFLQRALQ